jgi:protein AFG1
MEAYLRATIAENSEKFGGRASLTHINPEDWKTLCSICAPDMHAATMDSLFTTMDLNHDHSITENEIYSDGILGILQNRFNHTGSVHPIEGAYLCLPQPLFREDAGQVACIQELKAIWDTVVMDWQSKGWKPKNLKMVPDRNAKLPAQEEPKKEEKKGGFFSSVFGASTPAVPPPKLPMMAAPQAPKGLWMYGGNGCGKSILLDIFFRSLPEGFPVVRVHWHEFQRDVFRLTSKRKTSPDENLFDSAALEIAKNCSVLLLDDVGITHINEALNMKELCKALWSRGVTTLFTSNYRQQDLYGEGFNRAAFEDFIPDLAVQCPEFDFTSFPVTDHRIAALDDDCGNFVHPINAATLDNIKTTQQQLMEPHGDEPKGTIQEYFVFEIPGEGRSHKLAASGVGADGRKFCQVDFKSVFASAVGRSLFSALAMEYEQIFIVNAPKFDLLDQSAEFRRFAAFADLAYSKKVRIYIQGECDATEIFEDPKQGKDDESAGVVEDDYRTWVRMRSMLKEMRTSKYETVAWLSRNHQVKVNASQLSF